MRVSPQPYPSTGVKYLFVTKTFDLILIHKPILDWVRNAIQFHYSFRAEGN